MIYLFQYVQSNSLKPKSDNKKSPEFLIFLISHRDQYIRNKSFTHLYNEIKPHNFMIVFLDLPS